MPFPIAFKHQSFERLYVDLFTVGGRKPFHTIPDFPRAHVNDEPSCVPAGGLFVWCQRGNRALHLKGKRKEGIQQFFRECRHVITPDYVPRLKMQKAGELCENTAGATVCH